MTRKVYAWQDGEVWYLSFYKREAKRPANPYQTQNEVIHEAERRGFEIEWLQ